MDMRRRSVAHVPPVDIRIWDMPYYGSVDATPLYVTPIGAYSAEPPLSRSTEGANVARDGAIEEPAAPQLSHAGIAPGGRRSAVSNPPHGGVPRFGGGVILAVVSTASE